MRGKLSQSRRSSDTTAGAEPCSFQLSWSLETTNAFCIERIGLLAATYLYVDRVDGGHQHVPHSQVAVNHALMCERRHRRSDLLAHLRLIEKKQKGVECSDAGSEHTVSGRMGLQRKPGMSTPPANRMQACARRLAPGTWRLTAGSGQTGRGSYPGCPGGPAPSRRTRCHSHQTPTCNIYFSIP